MRRSILFLALALLVRPLEAGAPDLAARAKTVLAQTSGTISVPGLSRPVTVLRDPWGVPHIYAETQDDLFFAQGFVAAQDRLWQMELWRRTAEGRLAEILGPEAVDRDRFARLLRYQGDMKAEYESYARNALVQLRRIREGSQIEEDHMRNRQMIVGWLIANSRAIEVRRRDDKTYYVVVDVKAFREASGRLLAEVQRIKAEGDYEAAKALFETYGVHFDPALRDEVVERVDRLKMPSYTGFVQPRLQAVRSAAGEITDVTISYPLDLKTQMLEYSGRL